MDKTYIALSAVFFLEYAIWGAWAPVLAARLLGPLKMSGKQTGWIYASLPLACIVSPLVAGQMADQWFNTEWILIGAHLIGTVLLFLAAKQDKFWPLFCVMFIYSLCYAATMPLVNAVIFANTEQVGKVFIWAPIAWALVGYMLTFWRMSRKQEGDGRDCLYLAAFVSLLMVAACFLLPETKPAGKGTVPILEAMEMLKEPYFLVFILASTVIAGLMQFYFLGTAQFMQDIGIQSKHVPGSMAIAQVAQAIATWFAYALLRDSIGFKWTLVTGATFWIVLYLIYLVMKPRALIILAQSLHGIAYVFFIMIGWEFAAKVAPEAIRSSVQALVITATTGIGLFFVTQLAGYVMDKAAVDGKFNWRKIWIVPGAIMLLGTVALIVAFHPPAEEKKDPEPKPAVEAEQAATVRPVDTSNQPSFPS